MSKKKDLLFWAATLACGAAAGVLRAVAVTHVDERGLFLTGDPTFLALQALTALFAVALLLWLRKAPQGSYDGCFPKSLSRGILGIAAGIALALSNLRAPMNAVQAVGIGAGVCMAAGSLCRLLDRKVWPGFHCVVCLFFTLNLIFTFRLWSAEPQLRSFAMQLFACVCLMLFAFHRACWDADVGSLRWTAWFGAAAVFFCLASLSDPAPAVYLAGGVWVFAAAPRLAAAEEQV